MPPRKRKTSETDAPSTALSLSVAAGDDSALRRKSGPREDANFDAVYSIAHDNYFDQTGAQAFPGQADEDAAKTVVNLLQRARQKLADEGNDVSLKKSVVQEDNGTYTVHFRYESGARKHSYTAKDVRKYASAVGYTWTGGRIPKEVREEFRAQYKSHNGNLEELFNSVGI